MKRQPIDWEKFADDVTYNGLVSKFYKQYDMKIKTNNYSKNVGRRPE